MDRLRLKPNQFTSKSGEAFSATFSGSGWSPANKKASLIIHLGKQIDINGIITKGESTRLRILYKNSNDSWQTYTATSSAYATVRIIVYNNNNNNLYTDILFS